MPLPLVPLIPATVSFVGSLATSLRAYFAGKTLLAWAGVFLAGLSSGDYVNNVLAKLQEWADEWMQSESTKAYALSVAGPWIAAVAGDRLGIALDPADPFSGPSLSVALSDKVGVDFSDVTSKEAIMVDMGTVIATRLNEVWGTGINTVWPPEDFAQEMADEMAAAVVASLSGQNTWLGSAQIGAILTAVRAYDGVLLTNTPAATQARVKARLRQRKYALTHRRVSYWEPRP